MLIMIGGTSEKDAMRKALQKLFTNNLASKCSWTGAKNNFKLKDLKIMMCMKSKSYTVLLTHFSQLLLRIFNTWIYIIFQSYKYLFF